MDVDLGVEGLDAPVVEEEVAALSAADLIEVVAVEDQAEPRLRARQDLEIPEFAHGGDGRLFRPAGPVTEDLANNSR